MKNSLCSLYAVPTSGSSTMQDDNDDMMMKKKMKMNI